MADPLKYKNTTQQLLLKSSRDEREIMKLDEGRKQEGLANFVKDLMETAAEKEYELAGLDSSLAISSWMSVLEQSKLNDLEEKTEAAASEYEQLLALQRRYALQLDGSEIALRERAEKYDKAHKSWLNQLVEIQKGRVVAIFNSFKEELSKLKEANTTDTKEAETAHKTFMNHLRFAAAAVEQEVLKERMQRTEERNVQDNIISLLRADRQRAMQSRMKEIHKKIGNTYATLLTEIQVSSEDDVLEHSKLTAKVVQLSGLLEESRRKILNVEKRLKNLRNRFEWMDKEYKEQNLLLKRDYDNLQAQLIEGRVQIQNKANMNRRKLGILLRNVARTKKKLDSFMELCENILVKADSCTKLESALEQLATCQNEKMEKEGGELHSSQDSYSSSNRSNELEETLEQDEIGKLDNFFLRYNKVLLDKEGYKTAKENLEQQNKLLRETLGYLESASSLSKVTNKQLEASLCLQGSSSSVYVGAAKAITKSLDVNSKPK